MIVFWPVKIRSEDGAVRRLQFMRILNAGAISLTEYIDAAFKINT